jgi:hypothetical protein
MQKAIELKMNLKRELSGTGLNLSQRQVTR